MDQSLYFEQVKQYFPGVAAKVVANLNGTTNTAINRSYRHLSMLTKQYSPDLKWQSISTVNNSAVAADLIAFDSSIPLKSRDSLGGATGDVPKIAMEMALREKQLTDLDIIARVRGNQSAELLAALFNDTARVITGFYERLEYMFLQGLSTGVTSMADPNNVGLGVRIDYGYLTANKFGTVGAIWSNTAATPFTDFARAQAKANADGNNIVKWMMDRVTFNRMIATDQVKQEVAAAVGFFGSVIPQPTIDQVNNAAQAKYGFSFEIVERSVVTEKDGARTLTKPWAASQIVGLTSDNVGTLTWGTLAEMSHPVANVNYTTVNDYILLSKYRENRPSLAEFTSSQGLAVPVIANVNAIYTLDTTTVQA
jgi:hypothetical protein